MKIINFMVSALMAFSSAGDKVSPETIEFKEGKADVIISEDMFTQNSNGYHSDIALLASVLSQCAYDGKLLNNAYEKLGFDLENDVTLFGYADEINNADYITPLINTTDDSLAFSLASRELDDTNLLVITLRGTNLNSTSDILHDISIFGTDFYNYSSPTGFINFFRKVSIGMSLYIDEHPEIAESADNGSLKILITGHSLGGAGTNLLGAYFNTHEDNNYSGFADIDSVNTMYSEILDIPQDDIFIYTFACPNVYYGDPTTADCDNIINIINESDLIPELPDGEKFGQYVYFDTNEKNGLSAHYGYKYINATENEIPDGVRYYGGAVDTEITENMFNQASDEYHKDIAEVAVALSSSAYNGTRDAGYYINSAYRQLGFKSENIEIYGYPSEDYSFSIASREIGQNTLLAVTLKGNSGQSDFYSHIKKDFSQPFMNSMTNPDYYDFYIRVKNALDEYISNHSEILNSAQNRKLKVLISGHSIGGATASLLDAGINSHDSILKISDDDVFVYTFGSPCVYNSEIVCNNIINVMNESDIVTLVPFGTKSGKTVTFDNGFFGMDCYEPTIYAENLPDAPNYTTYTQIILNNPYAEYNIFENDSILNKDKLKTFSDDLNTYIYLPKEDYKIVFSGKNNEILELSVKDQSGGEKYYKNIALISGKIIEYDTENAEMYVNDQNGEHIMKISTEGTEYEIKKTVDSEPEVSTLLIGAGAVCAVIALTMTIKNRKKGD
ncbi:MAG: hypothetical protein K2J32_10045 [Ruminococcus sp.]|nr:hypothetical protein [Ruminococcus sp.]